MAADDEKTGRARGRPRQGKPVARHLPRDEEILRIAAEVFFMRGFDGAKLDDIARAAGIVKGSLYHYFDSKEDIFQRLIADIVQLVDVENWIDHDAPADKRLRDVVSAEVRMTIKNPVEMGLIGRELALMDGEIGDWARTLRRKFFGQLRDIIIEGQQAGLFRSGDAEAMAAFATGAVTMLCDWYRPGGRMDADAMVEEMTAFVMAGIGSR